VASKLADQAVQQQQSRICSGQLPLKGKSALIIEDNPLIAQNLELCLMDAGAGAAVVKTANSIVSAKSALDEGTPFDVAVVDLILAYGNACALIQVLSERGIGVVIGTSDVACKGQPALRKAVTILQKPYPERDLINALTKCAAAAPLVSPGDPTNLVTISPGS
jgi:DNA-binding NtrC family response regulator